VTTARSETASASLSLSNSLTLRLLDPESTNQRSGSAHGFTFRSRILKDFSYRLFDGDDSSNPRDAWQRHFQNCRDGTEMTGALIVLLYDAEKISTTPTPPSS